ncbi:MAG TPA: hypothetical protein VHY08_20030 [Bacillota bacterium]|nr:hypothetical protein [Bacillota bacterium]
MSEQVESFINEVLERMVVDDQLKKRIAQDLRSHITEASRNQSVEEVLGQMGGAAEVAREFMDSVYEDKSEVIERLIRERLKLNQLLQSYMEYRSKIRLFGLPLVHIKFRRYQGLRSKPGIAKGIIAIGDIAVGVLAIGGLSCGGFSFGGLTLGLLAFGGMSAGVVAIGGFTTGILAIGGFACGLGAIGGFTTGLIAEGGFAKGVVAIGSRAVGKYILNIKEVQPEQVRALIHQAYPHLSEWIVKIFTLYF